MNIVKKIIVFSIVLIFLLFPSMALAANDLEAIIESEAITEADLVEIQEILAENKALETDESEESVLSNNLLIKLELNKRFEIHQGAERFLYTPKETGDYQFWLELEPDVEQYTFGVGMDNHKPPISVRVSNKADEYHNVYLKAGTLYDFYISGCKAVILKQEPVATLDLNKTVSGAVNFENIFVFSPKERGRYLFSLKQYDEGSTFGSLILYTENNGGESDNYLEKSIMVEAGERCYITTLNCKNLSVKKIGYQDENPRISELWILRDQNQLYLYPSFKAGNGNNKFSVNNKNGMCKAMSNIQKPWLAVTVDSEGALPTLKNSNGKTIAWRETQIFRDGRRVYATPLSINGFKRKYTLTITPESGNQKNNKIYYLILNGN